MLQKGFNRDVQYCDARSNDGRTGNTAVLLLSPIRPINNDLLSAVPAMSTNLLSAVPAMSTDLLPTNKLLWLLRWP